MRGIYELKFTNGMCYVGLSTSISTRFAQHLRALEKGSHQNKYVQECYDKFGPPVLSVIEYGDFSYKELDAKETEYLHKYRGSGIRLLNIAKVYSGAPVIQTKSIPTEPTLKEKVRALTVLKKIKELEQ